MNRVSARRITLLDVIPLGQSNARTAKELRSMMNYRTDRRVTKEIERLRHAGHPIAAVNMGDRGNNGYFLVSSVKEAEAYLRTMYSRMKMMHLTCVPIKSYIKELGGTDQFSISVESGVSDV